MYTSAATSRCDTAPALVDAGSSPRVGIARAETSAEIWTRRLGLAEIFDVKKSRSRPVKSAPDAGAPGDGGCRAVIGELDLARVAGFVDLAVEDMSCCESVR